MTVHLSRTCESNVQLFEYFIVYCYFLVAIHPCIFCKIAPIYFVMVIFAKKSVNALF